MSAFQDSYTQLRPKHGTPDGGRCSLAIFSTKSHQRSWWIVHSQPTRTGTRSFPNPTNAVGGSFILSRSLPPFFGQKNAFAKVVNRARRIGGAYTATISLFCLISPDPVVSRPLFIGDSRRLVKRKRAMLESNPPGITNRRLINRMSEGVAIGRALSHTLSSD